MAFGNALYRYTATKGKKDDADDARQPDTLIWLGSDQSAALAKGEAIALGVSYAKHLGNLPPNICTPSYLASEAQKLAANGALDVTILDEEELEKNGRRRVCVGGQRLVSAGQNDCDELPWRCRENAAAHMILGKGITFDTGGISLKPGLNMDEMKYDMCGAASVLGTMKALLTLKPAINVIGMITSAENMPAGHASKPGDVVTTLSGKTVEILNTDAEGRLVLCDAMTYGINTFKPASLVDIATLTGACMAALGRVNSGLFTTDETLAGELQQAASYSGDKVWRLPWKTIIRNCWIPTLPTSPTSAARWPAPPPPPVSCRALPKGRPGRTWILPAPPGTAVVKQRRQPDVRYRCW